MMQSVEGLGAVAAAAALLGLVAGVLVSQWQAGRSGKKNLRVSTRWPLQARSAVDAEERKVWHWLHKVFYDHQILLKTPLTCFTRATSQKGSLYWLPLLRGMYCSFTVCTADGRVLACVDVLKNDHGLPRGLRQFKRALLSRCSIAYSVVVSDRLPTMEEIRLELLGDALPSARLANESPENQADMGAARGRLHAAIHRRRHMLRGDTGALPADGEHELLYSAEEGQEESAFYSGSWQQCDSFIAPLEMDDRPQG